MENMDVQALSGLGLILNLFYYLLGLFNFNVYLNFDQTAEQSQSKLVKTILIKGNS